MLTTEVDKEALASVAISYKKHGFNVLVLGAMKKGKLDYKAPVGEWTDWQEKVQTEEDVQKLAWSLPTTKGLAGISGLEEIRCLDFDATKNADGTKNEVPFEVVEDLCRGLGIDCNSYEWIVQTGTGWHVWLRAKELPKDFFKAKERVNKKELVPSSQYEGKFKAIELRWSNHYTALPPSLHETGKKYTFKNCFFPSAPPAFVDVEDLLVALEPLVQFKHEERTNSGNGFRNQTPQRLPVKHTEEEVRELLSYIPPQQEHIEWKKTVAGVVSSGLPEEVCVKLLEAWSPCLEGPSYQEVIRHKLERVSFATLVFQARQGGWSRQEPTKADLVQEWLLDNFELRFNEIRRQVEFKPKGGEAWNCADDRTFRQWKVTFEKLRKKKVPLDDLRDYAQDHDVCTSFDPIRTFFDSLPTWNGEDVIAELAKCVDLHHEGTEEVFVEHLKKWLVGTYSCGYFGGKGGNKNELFLVLQGGQGVGKTTFLRYLVPNELQDYKVENVDSSLGKDATSLLSKAFVHVDEELATMTKADIEKLKGLLSMEHFYFRGVYKHSEELVPRRVSHCGSTNQEEFLRDPTGNRRFLVHKITKIHRQALRSVSIVQAWAQAKALHEQGFKHWLEDQDIAVVEELNRSFQLPDYEEGILLRFYRKPVFGEVGEWLQATEIAERLALLHDEANTVSGANSYNGPIHDVRNAVTRLKVDTRLSLKVGSLLAKNGFEAKQKKLGDKVPKKRWHVVRTSVKELQEDTDKVPF